jgi:hypothetical protein
MSRQDPEESLFGEAAQALAAMALATPVAVLGAVALAAGMVSWMFTGGRRGRLAKQRSTVQAGTR